jgi:hypothetical protein
VSSPPYTFGDKDPASNNEGFSFDLGGWLNSPIAVPGTVWSISGVVTATASPNDLTVNNVVSDGRYVTVYLSGGTAGVTYTLYIHVNRINQFGSQEGPVTVGATIKCVTPVAPQ